MLSVPIRRGLTFGLHVLLLLQGNHGHEAGDVLGQHLVHVLDEARLQGLELAEVLVQKALLRNESPLRSEVGLGTPVSSEVV